MPGLRIGSAPSVNGGVGSPVLALSPTSASASHSQPATASLHTPTVGIAIRPGVVAEKPPAGPPLNQMSMASVLTPASQSGPARGPVSMTSKEWVVPPRPKPGRKPATDTPPTKRKAQNRAAQRAFRERRAARVGELEEHLDEEKAEHERIQRELKERIQAMEVETQTLRTRCQVLENMLERERQERRRWSNDGSQRSTSRPGSMSITPAQQPPSHNVELYQLSQASSTVLYGGGRNSTTSTSSGSAPRDGNHSISISQIISPLDEVGENTTLTCGSCAPGGPCVCANEAFATVVTGCGKCSLGTRCECLEASINATIAAGPSSLSAGPSSDLKRRLRSASPCSAAPDEKRPRSDAVNEIDFTNFFVGKKQPTATESSTRAAVPYHPLPSHQQLIPPRDSCGFCTEGTYCACADAALLPPVVTDSPTLAMTTPTTLPPSQVQTPPPSEHDVVPPPLEVTSTGAIKLPGVFSPRYDKRGTREAAEKLPMSSSSCRPGGPGTCAQCVADPKSGLFCRSLAASLDKVGLSPSTGGSGGCCGGGDGSGGRCKKQPGRTIKPTGGVQGNKPKDGAFGVSLSCADTYKTLSSHRHFNEATDEIGTWLPMLKAAPRPQTDQFPGDNRSVTPRPAMEVEAASIMSVLKGFDVRFGN